MKELRGKVESCESVNQSRQGCEWVLASSDNGSAS